jgi:hypothetical protein
MGRLAQALRAPAWIAGGALALWLWIGTGFANYDTLYALVWGQQLSRGQTPTYRLPIAPTPHPLAELVGLIVSPLGAAGAENVIVAIGYASLAGLGYVVYKLGAAWFSRAVGLLATALLITREPILSYGIRAYVDVPYVALVLAALLVETRRPRAGAPVLALLAIAGLLRPEAWLLSGAYWLYLAIVGGRSRGELARLVAIVVAAPILWALSDLLITGNPVWSLTKTRSTAATLQRVRGIGHVPVTGSRRIGEVLRPDGLIAAGLGGVLSLWLLRERAMLGFVVGVVAVVALAILASAGLPIDTRYVFLPAALLVIFAGAGVFGWQLLPRDDRWRRLWQLAALAIVAAIVAFIPSQRSRLDRTFDALGRQQRIQSDLVALVRTHSVSLGCGPVGVPNHAPIPLVALRLHAAPSNVVSEEVREISRGVYVDPADREVQTDYVLDPHDPHPIEPHVPRGFNLIARNASWRIYARCA